MPNSAPPPSFGDLDGRPIPLQLAKVSGSTRLARRVSAGEELLIVATVIVGEAPSFKRDDAGRLVRVETLKVSRLAVVDDSRKETLLSSLDAATGQPPRLPLDDNRKEVEEE